MANIHPLACVDPQAELGADVSVGAFSYIGAQVRLGERCVVHPHATILGPASFGAENVFYPGCVLGAAPQDLKYKGGPTRLVAGSHNTFREMVTVHRGTEVDRVSGGITRIGDRNLLMVGVHIAHDADIGSHVIIANAVQLAGHVKIEDMVNIGGAVAIHHFVTVGRNSFVGGMTRITHDTPPFMKIDGHDQLVRGVNVPGLRRWKFTDESIAALKAAWKLLYARRGENGAGRTVDALREIESNGLIADAHVRELAAHVHRKLEHGVFGRVRESQRTDTPQDRAAFYQTDEGEPSA